MCFNDPWCYAVETLMSVRSKVRFQTKRDTGVYAVGGRSAFASRTRLLIRRGCANEPVMALPEEDPTSLKMGKLESVTPEGPDFTNFLGPTVCQSHGNRSNEIPWTWHQR